MNNKRRTAISVLWEEKDRIEREILSKDLPKEIKQSAEKIRDSLKLSMEYLKENERNGI